jgi:hypothetical protein
MTVCYYKQPFLIELNNFASTAEQALKRPDSSNFPPGSQIALAKVDYVAKTQDELMFLAGDEILILKKLDNGKYLASQLN